MVVLSDFNRNIKFILFFENNSMFYENFISIIYRKIDFNIAEISSLHPNTLVVQFTSHVDIMK